MTGYLLAAALTAVMALPGMPVAVLLALVIAAAIARLGIRAGAGVRTDVPDGAAVGLAAASAAADGIAPAGGVAPADGIAPARTGMLKDSLRGMREVFALPALRRLVGAAGLLSFLPYLVFFTSPSVFACIPLLALSGMCSMYSLGLDARVRAACPEGLFARMMAVNSAGMMTIQALGFCLAGLIGGLTSPGIAVGVAGAAGIACTLLLWPRASSREHGGWLPRGAARNERAPGPKARCPAPEG